MIFSAASLLGQIFRQTLHRAVDILGKDVVEYIVKNIGVILKIEKIEVAKRIFALRFESQYEACSTFMRVAEYYESPFKEIRGKFFTLEQYMDTYAKSKGNFTYTIDWGGFNIPGETFKAFFEIFKDDLLVKEARLRDLFFEEFANEEDFYVIGHYESDTKKVTKSNIETTLAHEVAHGKFYLEPKYKQEALKLIKSLPEKSVDKITKKLLDLGYTKGVIKDEIQAYLATSDPCYIKSLFGLRMKGEIKKFQNLLLQYVEDD